MQRRGHVTFRHHGGSTRRAAVGSCVVTLVALISLSMGTWGCGSQAMSSVSTAGPELSDRIRHLETGDSAETVEKALGSPDREDDAGGEKVFYYDDWQLSFSPRLRGRTKYLHGERWKSSRALSHAIRQLELGETVADVRARLGSPWALQILKSHAPERVILWYGQSRWALEFLNGALAKMAEA